MDVGGNTVLITGGATGIGFALAERFVDAGSVVIACGRRRSKLRIAKRELPALHVKQCDVSMESDRKQLVHWVTRNFPHINILVNNAGIQRQRDFSTGKVTKFQFAKDNEVAINLVAPIRLCELFTPVLMKRSKAAIVNVSSGLAFVPIAMMPVYCATKAALHSFTISLRHQLQDSSVRVFEAAPPATDTDLDRTFAGAREREYRGISPREVAVEIMEGMKADRGEIRIGEAQRLHQAALVDPEAIFRQLNG